MTLAACGFIYVKEDLMVIACDADTCSGDKNTKLFWEDAPYGFQFATTEKSLVPIASKAEDVVASMNRYVSTIQKDVLTAGVIRILYEGKERIAIIREREEDVYCVILLDANMVDTEKTWEINVDPIVDGDSEYDELEDFFNI